MMPRTARLVELWRENTASLPKPFAADFNNPCSSFECVWIKVQPFSFGGHQGLKTVLMISIHTDDFDGSLIRCSRVKACPSLRVGGQHDCLPDRIGFVTIANEHRLAVYNFAANYLDQLFI